MENAGPIVPYPGQEEARITRQKGRVFIGHALGNVREQLQKSKILDA
jgi:hypothetical protein